jgi:hypothetical protein
MFYRLLENYQKLLIGVVNLLLQISHLLDASQETSSTRAFGESDLSQSSSPGISNLFLLC